jgi:hypothetical protein
LIYGGVGVAAFILIALILKKKQWESIDHYYF